MCTFILYYFSFVKFHVSNYSAGNSTGNIPIWNAIHCFGVSISICDGQCSSFVFACFLEAPSQHKLWGKKLFMEACQSYCVISKHSSDIKNISSYFSSVPGVEISQVSAATCFSMFYTANGPLHVYSCLHPSPCTISR